MSRPEVDVVMPFAGDRGQAQAALAALRSLKVTPVDRLILVDNSGAVPPAEGVTVVSASGERSPAYARNVGAAHASASWILFLDADTRPAADLLDAYFSRPMADEVGAVAGEVRSAPSGRSLVARYGVARAFLSQRAHFEHPFAPRAAAANLLVRRAAFEQVGGFFEGVRAAEDTDFSWRLQAAGWRLELRPEAWVEHQYRATLRDLRSQWRGYAAGRAWLARRYEGFVPRPAVARAWQRARSRGSSAAPPRSAPPVAASRAERSSFLALDVLLALEELAGFALSNRAGGAGQSPVQATEVVLVADRFPARGDPLVELARTLNAVRVEALSRPRVPDLAALRELTISYLEDDGSAARLIATLWLGASHPLRCARDRKRYRGGELPLRVLAPAALRLERDRRARVHSLGAGAAGGAATRLAALSGSALSS